MENSWMYTYQDGVDYPVEIEDEGEYLFVSGDISNSWSIMQIIALNNPNLESVWVKAFSVWRMCDCGNKTNAVEWIWPRDMCKSCAEDGE